MRSPFSAPCLGWLKTLCLNSLTALTLALTGISVPALGQVVVIYGTNLDNPVLPNEGEGTQSTEVLALGYDLALRSRLSLTPSVGVLVDRTTSDSLRSPSGYALGVWGQYDLLTFGNTTTYALGGLSFVDFGDDLPRGINDRSEVQYGLGFGAELPLIKNVDAFTNLRYTLVEGELANQSYNGSTTGLEIGIEISF